ncbi:hypothetical protein [uncultured Duncaniella sp.]|uniref:hypothetical protein n=1 Tax=uncultured Duncaniella sp. TaxID=2768039 RepID=UPI002635DBDE|nr:hypothetical protein [uncultured Duncaniella sp.]
MEQDVRTGMVTNEDVGNTSDGFTVLKSDTDVPVPIPINGSISDHVADGLDLIDFLIAEGEKLKEKDYKPANLYPTPYETTIFVHTCVRRTKSGRRKARYEGHVFGGRTTTELLMKWGQYRSIQNFLKIQRIIRYADAARKHKEMKQHEEGTTV